MKKNRRYWRPETERLIQELEKAREMDRLRLLTRPIVIQMPEEGMKELDKKIQEQIIKSVQFPECYTTSAESAPAPGLDWLLRTVEEIKRVEALNELAKITEESMTEIYKGGELKLVEPERDPWKFRKFWLMPEPLSYESMAVYERTDNNEG